MPPRQNAKAVAAKERKEAHQATKDAAAAKQREAQEAAEWKKGSNVRKQARTEAAAEKADDAARKRREKAELLAAEEANAGPTKKKTSTGGPKKKGKKKKDELSMLEDALIDESEKKTRAAKRAERLRKEREEKKAAEAAARRAGAAENADPLMANTDAMLGSTAEFATDGGTTVIGRQANVAAAADGVVGSGIDAALGAMSMGGEGAADTHPEKRMKALHLAFEEKMMPQMKEDYPGLRLRQYKEKIFQLWKKSPENPMNWDQGQKEGSMGTAKRK